MGKLVKIEVVIILVLGLVVAYTHADLQLNFYAKSCPKAEKIVLDYVNQHIPNAPSLAAALIRMHFHDCFVRVSTHFNKLLRVNFQNIDYKNVLQGCDASLLLNTTSATGNRTEKVATPNQTVRGFDFIDRLKSLLETECPGIVSCADIISLAARDSIVATVSTDFFFL